MKIPFMNQQTVQVKKINSFDEQKRLTRLYHNKNSKLRRIADYLWQHQEKEISFEQIAQEIPTTENTARTYVSMLNRCLVCPLVMMPVKILNEKGKTKYKKGFIQVIQKDREEYENWNNKKIKTMTSMNEVVERAEAVMSQKKLKKIAQIQR
jgi:hypothetical protein